MILNLIYGPYKNQLIKSISLKKNNITIQLTVVYTEIFCDIFLLYKSLLAKKNNLHYKTTIIYIIEVRQFSFNQCYKDVHTITCNVTSVIYIILLLELII